MRSEGVDTIFAVSASHDTEKRLMTVDDNSQHNIPDLYGRLIQLVFDNFKASGSWPKSRMLQIEFLPDDFWQVIEEVDYHLVGNRGSKDQPDSVTSLTVEGISVCSGNEELMSLFIRSLQFCVGIYTSRPESPTLSVEELQEALSLDEDESQFAMPLLFVSDRVWSGASHTPERKITELKLSPDILRYSGIEDVDGYLEVVRAHRPRRSVRVSNDQSTTRLRDNLLVTFDSLHPQISDRCADLYRNEHYSESVEAGFKVVLDRVFELTGKTKVHEAIGSGELYFGGSAASNVEKDFNEGVKFLLMAISRFRNAKSHTSRDKMTDPVLAYEYLRATSLAMRFLDTSAAK